MISVNRKKIRISPEEFCAGKHGIAGDIRVFWQEIHNSTIYSLTGKGKDGLKETFFMDVLETEEKKELLEKRLNLLQAYLTGISKQDNEAWKQEVSAFHVANLNRMINIVNAEISGTKGLLSVFEEEEIDEE